ncbi:hypothetical protein PTKIN_Ptkin16aG0508200 [Pterospermum kingtungense]
MNVELIFKSKNANKKTPKVLKVNNDHDGHPHQLELKKSQVPFFCDGCNELGFGLCYQYPNKDCDYILHTECGIRRPSPPFQQFFKASDFVFYKENPLGGTRICNACALNIQGFLYQCSHGDVDLHPCCATSHRSSPFPIPTWKSDLAKRLNRNA